MTRRNSSCRDTGLDGSRWLLSGGELNEWIDGLIGAGRRVIAPVDRAGLRSFRAVASAAEVDLGPGKTRWSPKEFLFPRTEPLYGYTLGAEGPELVDPPLCEQEQVLVGVRCCDAAGLHRLDEVFLEGGVKDPLYASRRERTTVVAFACARAGPECFCTAVDGSPMGTEGVDLLAIPLEDDWLLAEVTSRGGELASPSWSHAGDRDWALAEEQQRRVAGEIGRSPVPADLGRALEGAFDHPAWKETAARCLSCSVCAYVCPSCSCFDVHHEGNAWGGREIRCWDACTFPRFTLHASGHNPRGGPDARYRQRALHKFAYLAPDREGTTRCVGCGRCVALCPAGIDIHEAVLRIAEREGSGA